MVKPEPLKNKKMLNLHNCIVIERDLKEGVINNYKEMKEFLREHNIFIYKEEDIASAVEWLKEKMFKNDKIPPRSFNEVINLVDEAFEDVVKK